MVIAVDPGANGAFVWSVDGIATECHKMPKTDVEVCQLMADLSTKTKSVALFLETPSMAGYGAKIPGSAIAKLQFNVGIIYGASIAMGWQVHRIDPKAWQKTHPVGKKSDHGSGWKRHLKARAIELFPTVDVYDWNADALLIYSSAIRGVIN
jgi:hypothetical protein